jgi:Ca-activated chloride channel homolog
MSAWMAQFHFLQPDWLLLLAALPLLGWFALRRRPAQAALSRLVDAELLPYLLQGRARSRWLPVVLLAGGWTLGALALAGPSWSRVALPLYANRTAQVVAISLSQDMLARDVAPSRLDRARFKARDLFAANRDGLNGLVAYAGEAFVVAPLTSDASSLDELLAALAPDTMPVDGNDAAAAITRGAALIGDAKAGGGSLILITDRAPADAQAAARAALAAGVRVSVLGVGTPAGGPVAVADGGFLRGPHGDIELARRDDAGLAALAAAGGGRYAPMAADRGDVDVLHGALRADRGAEVAGMHGEQWQDRGPWLLLLLLPIAALAFRRGWLLLLPLVLLPLLPGRADATTWQDLWQRPDQQAAQALQQGRAKQAQQLARDPALRGAAAYRAGDYPAAIESLRPLSTADAQYNLGNALARAGHYREALDAYDRALKWDPADADAKANRKAVEDWLRRQQRQQQQQQQDDAKSGQQNRQGEGKSQPSPGKQDPGGSDKPDSQGNARGEQGEGKRDRNAEGGKGEDSSQPSSTGKASGSDAGAPMTAREQAEQQARAAKAQQALQQQMDRALGERGDRKGDRNAPHQLGTLDKDDPQSRLPAELRQALQRVPDDPGALLRRKFELEYRQRHGAASLEDPQP